MTASGHDDLRAARHWNDLHASMGYRDEPTPTIHPECAQALRAALRAEAARLLDHADRNQRNGHKANRDWCRAAAFGYLRACAVLRRLVGER